MNWRRMSALVTLLLSTGCSSPVAPGPQASAPSVTVPVVPLPTPTAGPENFPPPVARLQITVHGQSIPAVFGVDTVTFDASQSIGEGLTYRIDYWDETSSIGSRFDRVIHTVANVREQNYPWPVRLTVTDRFGRSASDEDDFFVVAFSNLFNGYNYHWTCAEGGGPSGLVYLRFDTEGPRLSGTLDRRGVGAAIHTFIGTITSDREVHLDARDGSRLEGSIRTGYDLANSDYALELIERGGLFDGRHLTCRFHVT